jgi:hypothetical protein
MLRSDGRAILLRISAPFSTSEYSMTPGGEIYIDAGAHGATKNILAVMYLNRAASPAMPVPMPAPPTGYPEPVPVAAPPAPYVEPEPAAPYVEPEPVELDTFTEPLQPYGEWTVVNNWGRVWRPSPGVVGADFTPYSSGGHWVWTDVGWTFESDYDWGWAPFHYGRWASVPEYGWVWQPGATWGPAWVDWRFGGGYVGWVPMGPAGYAYPEHHWTFVENGRFASPHFREFIVPRERVHALAVVTAMLPRSGRFHPSQPFGPPRLEIERAYGRPVPMVHAGSPNARPGVLPSHNVPSQYRGPTHSAGPIPTSQGWKPAPPLHQGTPAPQMHQGGPPPSQQFHQGGQPQLHQGPQPQPMHQGQGPQMHQGGPPPQQVHPAAPSGQNHSHDRH